MLPPSILAVVFDLGGIFVWDVWEHMYFDDNGLVKKYNLSKKKAFDVGEKIYAKYAYTTTYKDETWQKTEASYWNDFIHEFKNDLPLSLTPKTLAEMTDAFIHSPSGQLMFEIVENLKNKKIKIGVCSNTTNFWFERAKAKFNLEKIFPAENTILSYKIGKSKSDGFQMFDAVVSALKTPKENCIFFDDRENNVLHARQYGFNAVLVSPDSNETPELINKKN